MYEFIRGTGWVASTARKVRTMSNDGVEGWVIDRIPNKGESYINVGAWLHGDGSVNMDTCRIHVLNFNRSAWRGNSWPSEDGPEHRGRYVTVVFDD